MVDANVLISGIGWPRFAYEVLQHGLAGDFQLVLSEYVVDEARTHIARLLPDFVADFETFLQKSDYEAVELPTQAELEAQANLVRDPKDVAVALSAIRGQVDHLISGDRDLTDAGEPIHQHISVLLPGTFLRHMMGWTSEALEAIRTRTWDDLRS